MNVGNLLYRTVIILVLVAVGLGLLNSGGVDNLVSTISSSADPPFAGRRPRSRRSWRSSSASSLSAGSRAGISVLMGGHVK